MKAFHNDIKIKNKYVARVLDHQKMDRIVKGTYWQNGKGCAVGCTIEGSEHKRYETELGIPEWLAKVEDRLFEGMPNERAKQWPLEFLQAIKPGVNLDKIKIPFLVFIVESAREKFDHKKYPETLEKINNVLKELKKKKLNLPLLRKPRAAADAAYAYAAYAYAAAAYAAAAAAADAADAATYAAAYAADAATYAAAYAADAADAAEWRQVRGNAYVKFADKLLELMKNCK